MSARSFIRTTSLSSTTSTRRAAAEKRSYVVHTEYFGSQARTFSVK